MADETKKITKAYFHKHGVNNKVPRPNGTSFKFERLADSQGVIVLDPEADDGANRAEIEQMIKELRAFITKGVMGVSEIKEEQYEDAKKNLAVQPSAVPPSSVRVFVPASPLGNLGEQSIRINAPPAEALVNAPLAAVGKPAEFVAGEASSPSPAKQPRVGKPKFAQSRGPAQPAAPPAPKPEPVAAAPAKVEILSTNESLPAEAPPPGA